MIFFRPVLELAAESGIDSIPDASFKIRRGASKVSAFCSIGSTEARFHSEKNERRVCFSDFFSNSGYFYVSFIIRGTVRLLRVAVFAVGIMS